MISLSSDSAIRHASGWLAVTAAIGQPRPRITSVPSILSKVAAPPSSLSVRTAASMRCCRVLPFNFPRFSAPTLRPTSRIACRNCRASRRLAIALRTRSSSVPYDFGSRIRHREFRHERPPGEVPKSAATAIAPAVQPGGNVAPAAAKVTIRLLKYSPDTIQITAGETVQWANDDLTPHTVTSQGTEELNSGSIEAGASWRHTFAQPGTFSYFCTFHPEMKGVVVVR